MWQRRLLKASLFFFLSLLPFLVYAEQAEILLDQLTLKEKIAQLFMVPVTTDSKHSTVNEALKLMEEVPFGGVIFFYGTLDDQKKASELLQSKSPYPLLVGQDNEWGLSMRLKDALRFPRNLTLGALSNPSLIYELGKEIAQQCQAVGVHVNFAPVVDVNNNAANPVINDRSFGESMDEVAQRSLLLMRGLQDGGVLACAKHFPGHGDTHQDSHHVLPVLQKSLSDLRNLELRPFQTLMQEGLGAIMPAHLSFPLICDTQPTTLSEDFLQNLLKDELGFKGLVFTDSLKMKAINTHLPEGEAEFLALKAGNDVLVCSPHLKQALKRIEMALEQGEFSEEELNKKVLKILQLKTEIVASRRLLPNRALPLFSKEAKALKKALFQQALTLVHPRKAQVLDPHKQTAVVQIGRDLIMKDSLKISTLSIEDQMPKVLPPFFTRLEEFLPCTYFFLPKKAADVEVDQLLKELEDYAQVIVGVYEMNKYNKLNHGICPSTLKLMEELEAQKVWLALFGSPYSLKYFDPSQQILMAYENDVDAQVGAADVFLGKRRATGQLPITASSDYPRGLRGNEDQEDCGS